MEQLAPANPAQPGRAPAPGRVLQFPARRRPRGRWILPAALLLVLAVAGVLYWTGQLTALQRRLLGQAAAPVYQTTTVTRTNVLEQVTATGPVAAAQTLPLSFKQSGKLAEIDVQVGQKVKKGDVLARVDTTDLQGALDQAKANLQQAQAAYQKALQGATPEQIRAAQVALKNAEDAAADAQNSAAATQASAAKDVEAAQAQAVSSQNSLKAAQDALAAAQDQAAKKIAADQVAVDNAQKALDAARQVVATSPAILKQQLEKAKDDLWAAQISRDATCGRGGGGPCDAAKATVAGLETAVNSFNATGAQTQKQNDQTVQNAQNALETARAALASDQAAQAAAIKTAENNVQAAESAVNTASTSIAQARARAASSAQSAKQSANNSVAQVKTAEASLATTSAGPTKADVDQAAAQVANAEVAVKTAQNNLDGATLVAPMDGTITAISGTVGQWITGGAVTTSATSATGGVMTLATLDDLQVTANVNEADIGKIKVGDPVSFTVSAFPGKTLTGQVTQIQPTGVTTSNVVNFSVTSSIKSIQGAVLYPSMTAQVTITTAERDDVVVVPNQAFSFAQTAFQQGLLGGRQGGVAGGQDHASEQGGGAVGPAGAQAGEGRQELGAGQRQAGQRQGQGGQHAQNGQAGDDQPRAAGAPGAAAPSGQGHGPSGQGAIGGTEGAADGGRSVVMVLENGRLVPVRVTTGLTDGTATEIAARLQPGQSVVVGIASGGPAARTGGQSGPGQGPPGGPRPAGGPFGGGGFGGFGGGHGG